MRIKFTEKIIENLNDIVSVQYSFVSNRETKNVVFTRQQIARSNNNSFDLHPFAFKITKFVIIKITYNDNTDETFTVTDLSNILYS